MEIYKRGPFVTFQGIATFQSQCSWWKEKELSFIPSCWHVSYLPFFFFLPAFLNTKNHLTFLKFLVIQGIKMNLKEEEEDGSFVLPRTHQVTGPEALSPQARGLFHTDGNREGTKSRRNPHGLRTPLLRQSLCRRKGEARVFTLYWRFSPLTWC